MAISHTTAQNPRESLLGSIRAKRVTLFFLKMRTLANSKERERREKETLCGPLCVKGKGNSISENQNEAATEVAAGVLLMQCA